jgi:hypothetical protein
MCRRNSKTPPLPSESSNHLLLSASRFCRCVGSMHGKTPAHVMSPSLQGDYYIVAMHVCLPMWHLLMTLTLPEAVRSHPLAFTAQGRSIQVAMSGTACRAGRGLLDLERLAATYRKNCGKICFRMETIPTVRVFSSAGCLGTSAIRKQTSRTDGQGLTASPNDEGLGSRGSARPKCEVCLVSARTGQAHGRSRFDVLTRGCP